MGWWFAVDSLVAADALQTDALDNAWTGVTSSPPDSALLFLFRTAIEFASLRKK
jgi:hypothetical protein